MNVDQKEIADLLDKLQESYEQISILFKKLSVAIMSDSKTYEVAHVTTDEVVEKKEEEPVVETQKVPKNQQRPISEFGKRLIQIKDEVGMTPKELIDYVGFKQGWNVLLRLNPYGKTRTLIENSQIDEKYKRLLLDDLPKITRGRGGKVKVSEEVEEDKIDEKIMTKCRDFIRENGKYFQENINLMFAANEVLVKGERLDPKWLGVDKMCKILASHLNIDEEIIRKNLIFKEDMAYYENLYKEYTGDFIRIVGNFIYQLKWKVYDITQELKITAQTWNSYKEHKTIMPAKVFYRLLNGTIGRQSSYKPKLLECKYKEYNPDGYKKFLKLTEEDKKKGK